MEWDEISAGELYELKAYYGEMTIAILQIDDDGEWMHVAPNSHSEDWLETKDLEEAKAALLEKLMNEYEDEIRYQKELISQIEELRKGA